MHNILTVVGYACHFNEVDENNDIILPTAFQTHDIYNTHFEPLKVKFLYQHDVTRPIGYWTLIK